MKCVVRGLLLLLSAQFLTISDCRAANDVYETLVSEGIVLGVQESVKLPPPVLADGTDGSQQRKTIEALLAGRYEWDEFTRKSVVSPLLLKIGDVEPEAGQVSRRVDLYFVAYGSLEILSDDRKLHEQLDLASASSVEGNGNKVKVLSSDELASRGLPESQGVNDPRWVAVEATILNKVQVSFTTRNRKLETADSLLIATVVDPKFFGDADFPNCWRSISTDDAGRRQVGSPQPYPGLGSYVKSTRLASPAGAVFVEYHVVYAEPEGWFHGANLLRSKLPIVAQDVVRKLRRKMAE